MTGQLQQRKPVRLTHLAVRHRELVPAPDGNPAVLQPPEVLGRVLQNKRKHVRDHSLRKLPVQRPSPPQRGASVQQKPVVVPAGRRPAAKIDRAGHDLCHHAGRRVRLFRVEPPHPACAAGARGTCDWLESPSKSRPGGMRLHRMPRPLRNRREHLPQRPLHHPIDRAQLTPEVRPLHQGPHHGPGVAAHQPTVRPRAELPGARHREVSDVPGRRVLSPAVKRVGTVLDEHRSIAVA